MYLHRICNDDPVYKLTKTVYSVLPGEVTGGLNENILARMRADGIPARDLKKFKGMTPDTKLLHKIAIEYSDAVIFYEETPDPELLEIVQAREIPYITGVELKERGLDAYSDLYNKLSPK